MRPAWRRPRVVLLFLGAALSSSAIPLRAFDLAGVIPPGFFAEDRPAFGFEFLNDSTAFGPARVEADDGRSFGAQAYASWRGFALGIAYEGFTFRGDPPEAPARNDELAVSAAWLGSLSRGPAWDLRAGGGGGLRAWGDYASGELQRFWHEAIGVDRPFPEDYLKPALLPFAYAALEPSLKIAGPLVLSSSIHILVVAPGALESSLSLLASVKSRASENWIGARRQDRFGSFFESDSRANSYESGTWIVWGVSTGFLSFENSMNTASPFSLGTIACRFGGDRRKAAAKGSRPGPRQELAFSTALAESAFGVARFVRLGERPEIRFGLECAAGVSRTELPTLGTSVYQELDGAVEVVFGDRSKAWPRPFLGISGGPRKDLWSVVDLQRSSLLKRGFGFGGEAYAGLRLFEFALSGSSLGKTAMDLGVSRSASVESYPPSEWHLFLRFAVAEG